MRASRESWEAVGQSLGAAGSRGRQRTVTADGRVYGQWSSLRWVEDPASDPPKRNLRFDSIVITHWDLDHYDSVLGLPADSFERS